MGADLTRNNVHDELTKEPLVEKKGSVVPPALDEHGLPEGFNVDGPAGGMAIQLPVTARQFAMIEKLSDSGTMLNPNKIAMEGFGMILAELYLQTFKKPLDDLDDIKKTFAKFKADQESAMRQQIIAQGGAGPMQAPPGMGMHGPPPGIIKPR